MSRKSEIKQDNNIVSASVIVIKPAEFLQGK
jgi:hypothetical protein